MEKLLYRVFYNSHIINYHGRQFLYTLGASNSHISYQSFIINNQLKEVLGIRLYLNFTTTYVSAEHRQNTGYISLLKYKCIFSKILYIQE